MEFYIIKVENINFYCESPLLLMALRLTQKAGKKKRRFENAEAIFGSCAQRI